MRATATPVFIGRGTLKGGPQKVFHKKFLAL